MPGSAVTEVSIDNILHEYSTIDGVQEDVLEILLNIKKLALVLHEKESVEITLRKKGSGPVLASDISDNPDLEIKNPDFCIANITNEKTELVINMIVSTGRGYQPDNADIYRAIPVMMYAMITPDNTNQHTIKLQWRQTDTNAATMYLNRSSSDNNAAWITSPQTTMTVMEVDVS